MRIVSDKLNLLSKYIQGGKYSIFDWGLLLLACLLLFLYSLPHVIALTKLLIFIGFLLSINLFRVTLSQKPKGILAAITVLGILQIWMLFITLFISDQPMVSLKEWKGQWLPAVISFIIGSTLAFIIGQKEFEKRSSLTAFVIFLPISLFILAYDIVVVYDIISNGFFITHHPGITDHTATIGYLIAMLGPILIADLTNRILQRGRLIPVPAWVSGTVLSLGVFALVAATSRIGLLILALAFCLTILMMYSEFRKTFSRIRIVIFLISSCILLSGFIYVSYKIDKRWQNFLDTVPVAWDIDRDKLWLSSDGTNLPVTSSSSIVEVSAYNRIAWLHEGWRMLKAHPWGVEISRNTFHDLVKEKYGIAGMSHSHNAWIDLGLNVGIFGLLLFATFLFLMIRIGWTAWRTREEPLGIALVLLVILFAVRGLGDSIFRDHILGQFMLVAGLLVGCLSTHKVIERKYVPSR